MNNLNGTWIPVRQEMGGTELPAVAFEKQQLIIQNSFYTMIAETTDKGVVRYQGDKLDIYGKEGVNMGKHFRAVFKLEDGKLIICYDLTGNSYPQHFETKNNPQFFLSEFKKK